MEENEQNPLPCPFCGEKPDMGPAIAEDKGSGWGWVGCNNEACFAMPMVENYDVEEGEPDTHEYHQEKAIRQWNIRSFSGSLQRQHKTIEEQSTAIVALIDCLKDMEKGDDGHAWKVARRLIEKYGEKK